jgi:hypothetical protein
MNLLIHIEKILLQACSCNILMSILEEKIKISCKWKCIITGYRHLCSLFIPVKTIRITQLCLGEHWRGIASNIIFLIITHLRRLSNGLLNRPVFSWVCLTCSQKLALCTIFSRQSWYNLCILWACIVLIAWKERIKIISHVIWNIYVTSTWIMPGINLNIHSFTESSFHSFNFFNISRLNQIQIK